MFEKLFEKFKKREITTTAEKTSQQLEQEFDLIKKEYAKIATSDLYKLFKNYYEARIEINRDLMEEKNPIVEGDRVKFVELRAENNVMRGFIIDIEDMKTQWELEQNQPEL